MKNLKRIIVSTTLGLISGAIAVLLVNTVGANPHPPEIVLRMLITFSLMGFVIGSSSLRWHWTIHGPIIGGLFGLIEGLAAYALINLPELIIIPMIYAMLSGFLIELIVSVGFKTGVSSMDTQLV